MSGILSYKNMTLILIAVGVAIMSVNLFKCRSIIQTSKRCLGRSDFRLLFFSCSHQGLLILFLVGYCFVFFAIFHDISLTGSLLLGVIFFFGAVFVAVGLFQQAEMLSSIQSQNRELAKQNYQLEQTEATTIFALAYQAELRDLETGQHIERTSKYVGLLVEKLSEHPDYSDYLSAKYKRDLVKAAPLHDIGKVGVPDAILKKKGRLTEDEFAIMKKHCEYGARVLEIADEKLGFESFLKLAIQIVLTHHEKWDGSGYPRGLKGEDIPLSGRIMAVADVYDALRSERCYKDSYTHERTCEILRQERGKHFDPLLIDVFFECEKEFETVSCLVGWGGGMLEPNCLTNEVDTL